MGYLDFYQRRVLANGETVKEMEENIGRRNFEYMLKNKTAPTVHTVKVSLNNSNEDTMLEKFVDCDISNVTMNDQDKYDEKYIRFTMEELITYGSYVSWKDAKWLILYEENNSFEIYRTFTMRRCNNTFKFKYKGVVYEIPQVVKNLTLYSDGMDDDVYISKPDSQRQILMADNDLTRKIKVNTRVMLTNSTVYRITHIDDFSRPGVRIMICKETTLISLDDLENNIAYNEQSEQEAINTANIEITGLDNIYLQDFTTYTVKNGVDNYVWKVVGDKLEITYQDKDKCNIKCNAILQDVNSYNLIELYCNDVKITEKQVWIRGLA